MRTTILTVLWAMAGAIAFAPAVYAQPGPNPGGPRGWGRDATPPPAAKLPRQRPEARDDFGRHDDRDGMAAPRGGRDGLRSPMRDGFRGRDGLRGSMRDGFRGRDGLRGSMRDGFRGRDGLRGRQGCSCQGREWFRGPMAARDGFRGREGLFGRRGGSQPQAGRDGLGGHVRDGLGGRDGMAGGRNPELNRGPGEAALRQGPPGSVSRDELQALREEVRALSRKLDAVLGQVRSAGPEAPKPEVRKLEPPKPEASRPEGRLPRPEGLFEKPEGPGQRPGPGAGLRPFEGGRWMLDRRGSPMDGPPPPVNQTRTQKLDRLLKAYEEAAKNAGPQEQRELQEKLLKDIKALGND